MFGMRTYGIDSPIVIAKDNSIVSITYNKTEIINKNFSSIELERISNMMEVIQARQPVSAINEECLKLNELLHDSIMMVIKSRGIDLHKAYGNVIINSLESNDIYNGHIAVNILSQISEEELNILRYMCKSNYDNGTIIKPENDSVREGFDCIPKYYEESPIFSFSNSVPRTEMEMSDSYKTETTGTPWVLDVRDKFHHSDIVMKLLAKKLQFISAIGAPKYHTFSNDFDRCLYACVTDFGKWLVSMTGSKGAQ